MNLYLRLLEVCWAPRCSKALFRVRVVDAAGGDPGATGDAEGAASDSVEGEPFPGGMVPANGGRISFGSSARSPPSSPIVLFSTARTPTVRRPHDAPAGRVVLGVSRPGEKPHRPDRSESRAGFEGGTRVGRPGCRVGRKSTSDRSARGRTRRRPESRVWIEAPAAGTPLAEALRRIWSSPRQWWHRRGAARSGTVRSDRPVPLAPCGGAPVVYGQAWL